MVLDNVLILTILSNIRAMYNKTLKRKIFFSKDEKVEEKDNWKIEKLSYGDRTKEADQEVLYSAVNNIAWKNSKKP